MKKSLRALICAVVEAVFLPSGALRRGSCQALAVKVEVDEGEVRAQPMMVFGDSSIPHLVEAEDPLQDAERMLDFGPYTRLTAVLLFL